MTYLVRKLVEGSAWSKLKLQSPAVTPQDLPAWVYGEFTPRTGDNSWLSCFASNSILPEQIAQIAGAMSLFSTIEKGGQRQHYASVERSALEAAGFNIRKSLGNTYNVIVDNIHEEIQVTNLDSLKLLTHLFWSGQDAEIKGAKIGEARKVDAKCNLIRFTDAIVDKKENHAGFALSYVKEKILEVKAI